MSSRFAHGRDSRAGAQCVCPGWRPLHRLPVLAVTFPAKPLHSCDSWSSPPMQKVKNKRWDVGMLGMRSQTCWRPPSSLFEHGKHILYVTLVINKTLTSYTQLFFNYDNAWYNVFHEHFYLKLPLNCETKLFKMDCLNFIKNIVNFF